MSFYDKLKTLSLVLILFFYGCAVQDDVQIQIKDGKEYGTVEGAFRHRWWNYYERSLSFIEGEFWDEAAADLKEALRQRKEDQRMARTYGMHFVDYFPHRELGLCHLMKGNLEEALDELELSVRQYPSAKAYFYLDRVRKALIESSGRQITPPVIVLNMGGEEIWSNQYPLPVTGVISDENYIAGATVMGLPLHMERSRKHLEFTKNLELPPGRHDIEVVAVNLMGRVSKKKTLVHMDYDGPMVTIHSLKSERQGEQYRVEISGSLYDHAGAHSMTIEGLEVSLVNGPEAFFNHRLITGRSEIELVSRDLLGNTTKAYIQIADTSTAGEPFLLASLGSPGAGLLAKSLFSPRDDQPPDIHLKGWTESQTVFLKKIYLEGEIKDDTKIVALEINGKSILRSEGKRIYFNHLAKLQEGNNDLKFRAVDSAGNVSEKSVGVNREVPEALQLEDRLRTAVFPFEQKGTISDVGLSFQGNLLSALVDQNRFQVIEREKLDYVLQEQKLSNTDLIDKATALRLGKLIATQAIITGNIVETQKGIEIVGRMIDTETSQVMASEDVYGEEKTLYAIRNLSEGMAIKFHIEFPLVGGLVVQKKGKHIFTDVGGDKTKLSRRFLVYREKPIKHPVTGTLLGSDNTILGRARINQVMPNLSRAEVINGDIEEIKPLDKVIAE